MDVAFERALPGGAIDLSLSNRANGYRGNAQDLGYTKLADIKGDGTYLIVDGPSYLTDYPAFLAARGLRYATLQVCNAVDVYLGKILYAQNAGQTLNAVAAWCGPAGWIDIATATPPTEYDLPLANGWAHINADDPLTYGKCGDGRVQITGIIIAPAGVTTEQQIATLPAGYRPVISRTWLHAFDANTGIDYTIAIELDGTVKLWVKAPPTNATLVFPVQSFYGA